MERAAASSLGPAAVAFVDGLGERHHILDPTGSETLEVLCVRDELAAVPSFEFALRERVSRLATFRHPSFARVRAVERLTDRHATLAVVSEATNGTRLSDLLTQAIDRRINLDINSALCLLRQLLPAVVALHEHARDIQGFAHAALGPERLIVAPDGRLLVVEYVMGAALEQLRYSQERYWNELRLAVPRTPNLPRFDHRIDVAQIGIVALSLVLGRVLRDDEYPARVGDVVASTWAISARGGFEPLPPGLRGWLGRALHLDPRTGFATAVEARAELEKLLGDSDHLAAPASLEAFLKRFHGAGAADAHGKGSEPRRESKPEFKPEPAGRMFPSESPAAAKPAASPGFDFRPKPDPVAPPPAPPLGSTFGTGLMNEPPVEPRRSFDEEPDAFAYTAPPSGPRVSKKAMIAAGVVVALLIGGYFAAQSFFSEPAVVEATATGTLVLTSNPDGAAAFVDGEPKGMTPLTLTLPVGEHVVELRGAGEPRSIPVTIAAGMQASHYIELPKTTSKTGQLQIRTEPSGARVTVDGIARGTSPITVVELEPGEHVVVVESDLGSVKESVLVESGVTASLVVPLTGAAPSVAAPGWISVKVPVDVQIYQEGRLIGTNLSERIVMPAGRHDLEIVNETLGFRTVRSVQVVAGKVSPVSVDIPRGTLAVNAQPWAEVWVDGERIGETPIGNLQLTIGSHSLLFRHPELGEQHHNVSITLKGPTRLSVDMRKQP
jgi:hypothetical protein